ncbi:MAG: hypothetical protein R2813_12085 [Flavobacteriales bacterium]
MPRFADLLQHKMVLLLIAVCAGLFFASGHWQHQNVIRGDAQGYSAYLAAWVVHGQFDFTFYDNLSRDEKLRYWIDHREGLDPFPKLTMGLAYAQLPLFWIVHEVSAVMGWPQDGWSNPYHLSVGLTGLLVLLLGLLALDVWLRRRFSKLVSAATLLLLVGATNLLYYSSFDNAHSHQYSFSLFAIALWSFDTWLIKRKCLHLWGAALFFGWVTLIRPTNALFMLVPIIQLLGRREMWISAWNWKSILAVVAFLMPIIPQMVLWKLATGSWVFYSYGEEQIFWLSPHVMEGLFSFRNGWLVYTPLMFFAFIGLVFTKKIDSSLTLATTIVLPIHVYIVFSWWCWYYGSSLSIRPMIDLYPLLAFPLAGFIRWVISNKWWWSLGFTSLSLLLIVNNFFQTAQYHRGQLHGSDMTSDAFRMLFFNPDPPSDLGIIGLYSIPDSENLKRGLAERIKHDTIIEKEWSFSDLPEGLVVNHQHQFTRALKAEAGQFETTGDRIMEISAQIRSENYVGQKVYLVVSFVDSALSYGYHTAELHKMRLETGRWQRVRCYLEEPKDLPQTGKLEAYLWFQEGEGEVELKDLRIRQIDCPYVD